LSSTLSDVLGQYVVRPRYRDRSLEVFDRQYVGAISMTDQVKDAPLVGPSSLVPLHRHCGDGVDEESRGGSERYN
jgi:hypothetical protein